MILGIIPNIFLGPLNGQNTSSDRFLKLDLELKHLIQIFSKNVR